VLLHGRGSHEREILALADHLPTGPAYAAVRAGGLLLSDPERFAGAAILYGTLPFDAGVPVTPGGLAGRSVFVAQGEQDTVIPRELLDRTWNYILGDSGASVRARRDPGGHGISGQTLAELGFWLQEVAG